MANSCKAVADAVAQQAVTSSEGGKRLRALLTLDAFRAFAPQDVAERDMDAVLDLACAIEVFQTGALVHDDIIDDFRSAPWQAVRSSCACHGYP